MSFSDYYVTHGTRKGNFLIQIEGLIDWEPIEATIVQHYSLASDVTGRPSYSGLLLFKILLVGIWPNGLSDEAVEDMGHSNLHVLLAVAYNLKRLLKRHIQSLTIQEKCSF